ncbi:MAG: thioredoxin family protein [Sphingobacteriales bacterium]|nr:thioredoxin family protein [Sphingobacteriales bacterium]
MKFYVALLALLISMVGNSQPGTADAIMNNAFEKAKSENKNVFLMFHASWCGWCHKMDKSMNDPVCKKFFDDNFIVCHLVVDESKDRKNLENSGADELRKKYHGDGQGIPFWLIFDKTGNLLADSKMRKEGEGPGDGQNTGCPATEEEVNYFIEVLRKSSDLHPPELKIIRDRFRKNDL